MKGEAPKPGTSDIELCSGQYLNLEDPDPTVITLDVVAHHLSTTTRYAGAPRRPISIGEHALLVADYLAHNNHPPAVVLGGLHHDDSEAFIHDITRPLKEIINPLYKPVENRMMAVCVKALGLDRDGVDVDHPAVKEADHWALAAEAYYLMPTMGRDWWCWGLFDPSKEEHRPPSVWRLETDDPSYLSVKHRWLLMHYHTVSKLRTGRNH